MAGETFTITELSNGQDLAGEDQIIFEFDAAHRNIPVQPWSFGVKQRTQRTDYPGGVLPTEQVLGWNFEEFTLKGKFDDKYNTDTFPEGGYAQDAQAKLEQLVQRGNKVRLEFEAIIIEGIITKVNFNYRGDWSIGYDITVSPHHRRPGGAVTGAKSPRKALNADQLRSEAQNIIDLILEANAIAPIGVFTDDTYTDVLDSINALQAIVEDLTTSVSSENLANTASEAGSLLLSLASKFYEMVAHAQNIKELLRAKTSHLTISLPSQAVYMLEFEHWWKEMMYLSRRAAFIGRRNALELRERVRPNAKRIYRPQAGESLYAISNRFFGTPHSWRLIAEANNLIDFTFTGEELLVIPDQGIQ